MSWRISGARLAGVAAAGSFPEKPLIGSVRQQLAEIRERLHSHQTVEELADQIVAAKVALTAQEERIAGLVRQLVDQEKIQHSYRA